MRLPQSEESGSSPTMTAAPPHPRPDCEPPTEDRPTGVEGGIALESLDGSRDPSLEGTRPHLPDGPPPGEPDGFPEEDDLAGRNFAQYRMGAVLGRGTMGRVYRAEHIGLRRICAIKVVNPGLVAREPQTLDQFWAEARAIAGQIHPNIVTVHNLGTDRGYHFIEMEYVPGGVSLKEQVVRGGAMTPETATRLVRQVALALDAAHRSGLIHRDVKPANVLLTPDRNAKLADFGLARRLADGDTRRGRLAGTPTFMAPELFAGAPASPATDLYAVGVMYFYLLTARLPYTAEQLVKLISLHRKAPIPDVRRLAPNVPDEAAAMLTRLLAKDPLDRPRTAGEVAEELRRLAAHLRDTDELINEAIDGLGALVQHGRRDQYRIVFPVPGNRLQEVYIEVVPGPRGERLLTIFSVCGIASARHFEFALKLNAALTHGSISIREVNGEPMFVMSRSFLRANVTSAEVRAAVKEIARQGDQVEQQLAGAVDLF
jgi:serine/threonine protein kinase